MTRQKLARRAMVHQGSELGHKLALQVLAFSDASWCLMWEAGPWHCTHKYIGEVPDAIAARVKETVDQYFTETQPRTGTWVFDQPAWFGPDHDTYVLRRSKTDGMMLDLKSKLDQIVPDEWPYYRPHVSCDPCFESVSFQPERYVLKQGDRVMYEWKMLPMRALARKH